MTAHEFTDDRRLLLGILAAFLVVVTVALIDLVSDLDEGISPTHALTEGIVVIVGLSSALLVSRKLYQILQEASATAAEAKELADRLEATTEEARRWKKQTSELVVGLAKAIDEQFDRWDLSPAEKEVGMLLLKGLSHKEVASLRAVTEATTRQQARALYRKAGLTGRNDLAAFFLEDLMLPMDQR